MSIGETLSEARRQSGLTITQVSQRTRIRESIVRAIEQGDFSACGGDFYARGHIRSIAEAVGADPGPLIAEYDAEHGAPGSITAADVFQPVTPIKIRERRRFGLGKVMVLAVLAVIGYVAYHLVSTVKTNHPAAVTYVSPRPTRPQASPTPKATKPVDVHPHVVIRLTATQTCWVLVSFPNGTQLFDGTLQPGMSKTVKSGRAVQVRLGNPQGVVVLVDGKRQKLSSVNPITLAITPNGQAAAASFAPAGSTPVGFGSSGSASSGSGPAAQPRVSGRHAVRHSSARHSSVRH